MPKAIESIFAGLDRAAAQLPLRVIMDWLGEASLTAQELASYMVFSPERYVRNRVHDGPSYQALVLCWRNGQRSPIHNHRGSHCGVKVLRGVASETIFKPAANGLLIPVSTRELPAGHTCASADSATHQMSNLQAGS